ncbi:MAG: hypothetical protein QOE83_1487, partial [Actinomycetota bacterium]|nr:hypothetical protein [Actinomycetota bacterium]
NTTVGVSAAATVWAAARMSASGTCFGITDLATGATAGTYRNTIATCTGTFAAGLSTSDGTW